MFAKLIIGACLVKIKPVCIACCYYFVQNGIEYDKNILIAFLSQTFIESNLDHAVIILVIV